MGQRDWMQLATVFSRDYLVEQVIEEKLAALWRCPRSQEDGSIDSLDRDLDLALGLPTDTAFVPGPDAAAAMRRIAHRYVLGERVRKDHDQALCWLRASAHHGSHAAAREIAYRLCPWGEGGYDTWRRAGAEALSVAGAMLEGLSKAVELWFLPEFPEHPDKGNEDCCAVIDGAILHAQRCQIEGRLVRHRNACVRGRTASFDALRQALRLADVAGIDSALVQAGRTLLDGPEATSVTPEGRSEEVVVMRICREPLRSSKDFDVSPWESLCQSLVLRPMPPPQGIAAALDAEFPWMAEASARIAAELQLRLSVGRMDFHLRPLLLVGAPGTGKSRYAMRLAQLAGVPSRVLNLAGSSDSRMLSGTARGWSTAHPSLVVDAIAREACPNPVIVLDELDKVATRGNYGSVHDILHYLTEPETARRFHDECLLAHCNLSAVSFIATANSLAPIPRSLLGRFTLVRAEAPGPAHFRGIVRGMIEDFAGDLGVPAWALPALDTEDWQMLESFLRGRPVRDVKALLRRLIEDKAAVERSRPSFALH